MHTRIKICGITTSHDASHAADCGADAIGLVFYEKSSRQVSLEQARLIAARMPPFVACVGLFVNASREKIVTVLEHVRLNALQFHGDEASEECRSYGLPYIKAVPMGTNVNLQDMLQHYPDASALLLDSHSPGMSGGTGAVFDWKRAEGKYSTPIILAGGLDSDNVGAAINSLHPYAVDVSSGVESARGVKDPAKVKSFILEVRRADCKNRL